MTKFMTAALATTVVGAITLASSGAMAAAPSPQAAISSPGSAPIWVKMMKKKKMMMKKKGGM